MTNIGGKWKCHFSDCALAQDCRQRSNNTSVTVLCEHIRKAINSQSDSEALVMSESALTDAPFPPNVKAEFEARIINGTTALVQQVSRASFVVVTDVSSDAPLGLLHIRTSHNRVFQCTCHLFKRNIKLASVTTAPKLSKRCRHFCVFLWAIFSNESLKKEYSQSLQISHNKSGK